MKVVLASTSPRRFELLAKAGVVFEVDASPVLEIHDAAIAPGRLCEMNARLKASAVASRHPNAAVIGADTLVWIDQEPLGKPRDMEEARAMLRKLSGRTHLVCTGVCVIRPGEEPEEFHESTSVTFRELDDTVIEAYLSATRPLDKAGAYGIQDSGDMIVESIKGAFDNVMGLPVERVVRTLRFPSTERES